MTGAGRRNATLPTRYVRDAASPDSSGALQLRPGGKRVAPGLALRALPGTRSRWSLARRLGSALHAAVGYGRTSPPDAFGRFRSRWSLARRLGSALHAAVGYGRASHPDAFSAVRFPASAAPGSNRAAPGLALPRPARDPLPLVAGALFGRCPSRGGRIRENFAS